MTKKHYLTLLAAAFAASSSFGAFQINSLDTPHVITFDENIGYDGTSDNNPANDVIKVGGNGQYRLMEHGSSNWKDPVAGGTAFIGFSAEAWAWRHHRLDYSGDGNGTRTYWSDYNNNGALTNATGLSNTFYVGDAFNGNGNRGFVLGNPAGNVESSNVDMTLRVQNNTGGVADLWNVSFDLWTRDTDSQNTNLIVYYSTNDVDYIVMDTFIGATNAEWVNIGLIEFDTISATVNHGDYIYLRFHNDRASGSGTAWGFDNLSVTASVVPEPSTYAMISGLVLFAFAAIRRRKSK